MLKLSGRLLQQYYRGRALPILLLMSLGVAGVPWLLGELSLGNNTRLIMDFGFSMIQVFATLTALTLGGMQFRRFLEQGLWALAYTRGVSRWRLLSASWLVGFIGIVLFIGFSGLALSMVLHIKSGAPHWNSLAFALSGILLESTIILSFSFLISLFAKPPLIFIASFALSFTGHSTEMLRQLADKSTSGLQIIASFLHFIFPHFETLNFRNAVVDTIAVTQTQFLSSLLYTALWCGLLIVSCHILLRRRELV